MSHSIPEQAAKIGTEHGRDAASWVFDGNTTDDTYRRVLAGIESGDPEVYDAYRVPDLSGEYAGDYGVADLAREVGLREAGQCVAESDELDDACSAYEQAASEAFWAAIEHAARSHVVDTRIAKLQSAGFQVTYAARSDAEHGYLPSYRHYRQNWPADGLDAYVDLGSVASGDDAYGQVDTVRRSNFRRLQEDYPDMWTVLSYTNTDALAAFVADLTDDAAEVLAGLATDYPVYDDEDMSNLEDEEITEQWSDYAAGEFRGELADDVQEAWDGLADDAQRELFWSACEQAGYYPEHNGVEVLWSHAFEKTAGLVADKLR